MIFTSSRSIKGTQFPNFEMLDAKNCISFEQDHPEFLLQKKKKVSLEQQKAQKEDRFLRGRQIVYMTHDYFRVIGAHDSVLGHADLLSVTLRNDDVQEFDTRWDEILFSLAKIPPDAILESLYKLRIRESDQLKTVYEFVRHGDSSEDIDAQL